MCKVSSGLLRNRKTEAIQFEGEGTHIQNP